MYIGLQALHSLPSPVRSKFLDANFFLSVIYGAGVSLRFLLHRGSPAVSSFRRGMDGFLGIAAVRTADLP